MSAGVHHRAVADRRVCLPVAAVLMLAFAGCASVPQQEPASAHDLAWVLAGADQLPTTGTIEPEALPALLHITDEMRRFAIDATRGKSGNAGKVRALAQAVGVDGALKLQYDTSASLTAEQVFRQRRANCLSYTMLFVALAREVGLPARFNEVDIPPIWDIGDDDTFLLYKHINARIETIAPFAQIVDISSGEYDPGFDHRVISDAEAQAQFYNNRAVEFRLQQRNTDALRYQLRALDLSPNAEYLWGNLAGLYLQLGNARAARIAVTQALKLDPSGMLSYDTAAQAYDQLGQHRLARYFHAQAQHFLDQNPYHHYQLALAALRDQDAKLAYTETSRAILLYPKDPHFFFLLAIALQQLGETQRADDSLQVAIDLTADGAQQARYRSKFAQLAKRG